MLQNWARLSCVCACDPLVHCTVLILRQVWRVSVLLCSWLLRHRWSVVRLGLPAW